MRTKKRNSQEFDSTLVHREKISDGHELKIIEKNKESHIEIIAPDGNMSFSIVFTSEGPVLNFGHSKIKICSQGDIELDAENLTLKGRQSLSLSSDGNINLNAKGDLDSLARVQNIQAELGNVNLKANDDVKLRGERILLNN